MIIVVRVCKCVCVFGSPTVAAGLPQHNTVHTPSSGQGVTTPTAALGTAAA